MDWDFPHLGLIFIQTHSKATRSEQHAALQTSPIHLFHLCGCVQVAAAELGWNRRLNMALEAAKGMLYLHSRAEPVLHRDLKSANLLVDKHWRVKVADFNLSRVMNASAVVSSVSATNPRCSPCPSSESNILLWCHHIPMMKLPHKSNVNSARMPHSSQPWKARYLENGTPKADLESVTSRALMLEGSGFNWWSSMCGGMEGQSVFSFHVAQVDGTRSACREELRLCSRCVLLRHHPLGAADLAHSLGGPGPLAGRPVFGSEISNLGVTTDAHIISSVS